MAVGRSAILHNREPEGDVVSVSLPALYPKATLSSRGLMINLMWGGVQCSISRIKILRRDGFEINEFRDIYGIIDQGCALQVENLRQPFDF